MESNLQYMQCKAAIIDYIAKHELGVGSCTSGFCHSLKGCPPTETEMYEFLKEYMTKTKGTDSI